MINASRVPLGLYISGHSVVHRIPPGPKILLLTICLVTNALLVKSLAPAVASFTVVILISTFCAKVPLRALLHQLTGVFPILLGIGLLLWWRSSGENALTTVLVLLSSISAALLVTLTTRVSAMLESCERGLGPFARIGLPVDHISLALTLTLRLIPLQVQMVGEVLDARKARGSRSAGLSPIAFGVPIIVRTILRARGMGEALHARGVAD